WRITHNRIHHTFTNVHGLDEDLEVSPLLRLSPQSPLRPFHRFQHVYAPIAYSLSTVNWFFVKDFDFFLRKSLGPYPGRRHPAKEVAILVGTKLFCALWTIAIPLLVLDVTWWQFAAGFATVHLVGGAILGIVFQLAHVVEETSFPVPDAGRRIEVPWQVHQMQTTANFCVGRRWLTRYVGGLNHQIEHHLFPRTCSVHYPALAAIVRSVAERHGVPYHSHETFS